MSGCASPKTQWVPVARHARAPEDRGSAQDITTQASSTDTLDIVVTCREPGVGLTSKGTVSMPNPQTSADEYNRRAQDIQRQLQTELGPLTSGVGWGIGCDDGRVGPRVYVPKYGQIDAAVQATARWLERHNLQLHVLVCMTPRMELL